MSTALAYAPEPTEAVAALPTAAYRRPRTAAAVPVWCERVEVVIRAVGRFGLGPVPCIVLGFMLAVTGSLHTT